MLHKKVVRGQQSDIQKDNCRLRDRLHKKAVRAQQSDVQKDERKMSDRLHKKAVRAQQSDVQKDERKMSDRLHKKAVRGQQSDVQKDERKMSDRLHKKAVRGQESNEQRDSRRNNDKLHKQTNRAKCLSIHDAIKSFQKKVLEGPDYVCICCHRIMYKKSVVKFSKTKYANVKSDTFDKVFSDELEHSSVDGNLYICHTCHSALIKGSMSVKANHLELSPLASELSDLNDLETRLIQLRIPFMKMVALPSGKQRKICGPAVNVPSNIDNICTVLPRLLSQSELIPLKFKRKLVYRSHYMYGYVRPEKVINALKWLKCNNELYSDISINEEWEHEAMTDDSQLLSGLVEHFETDEPAAEPIHNDNMDVDVPIDIPIIDESSPLQKAFHTLRFLIGERGFRIHDISDNGNCLYDSVLFHLKCLGLYSNDSTSLRQDVADYLEVHRDLYADFICEALQVQPGNNYNCDTDAPSERDAMIASISDPVLRRLSLFNNYIRGVRSTAWGDHIVIAALCNIFSITINVLAIHTDYQTTTVTTPCSASSHMK